VLPQDAAAREPEQAPPPRAPSPPPRAYHFQTPAPPRRFDDTQDYSDAFGNVARRAPSHAHAHAPAPAPAPAARGGAGPSANGSAAYGPQRCVPL
jgi:hypothetical protein